MPRSSSKPTKAKQSGARSKRNVASSAQRKPQRATSRNADKIADDQRLFDERVRRDITGVVFLLLGVVLFVSVVLPSNALITSFLAQALELGLGLGAYMFPFVLIIVGVCFLIRFDRERVPLRVAFGLVVIFIAVLAFVALLTPVTVLGTTQGLFDTNELTARGGYIGAGIAWVGLTLFGQLISCIIMIGVIVIGLIIIGFSLSKLFEKIQDSRILSRESDDNSYQAAAPYAQVRNNQSASPSNLPHKRDAESEKTHILPINEKKERKTSKQNRNSTRLSAATTTTIPEPVGKEPETITRKLGRKVDTPSLSTPKEPATPLATPRPADGFELPSMDFLTISTKTTSDIATEAELKDTGECLQASLEDFGVMAKVVGWVAGPTVTLFKIDLPSGVRVSKITGLEDDIALALAAPGVRIFSPIPGTNYVGIEVPNRTRESVLLGDVIKDAPAGPLQIVIGKDVEGRSIVSDLAKMPHLLIGGTTGSGKSVSINAMIMSILMRATPAEVRFVMIDPKRVEFTPYNGIPHLYVPVVTEPREAASALSWGVAEMERRLKVFSKVGARNIGQYNAKVQSGQLEEEGAEELPYIVIIIDELADLMMNVGKEVEFSISRIAQLARAAGIHLIVATQRPSTKVVTGLIKANITNRIAFNVASGIDSRVILDAVGAENLIGLGDLLLSKPELAKPQRIQGCYVSEDEINAVVEALKEQGEPEYHSEILQTNLITLGASQPDGSGGSVGADDPLLWEAADIVVSSGLGSTSNIQRRLKVGYSRAGRIMDMLEEKGVVGPPNGSKPREVLVDIMELETLKAFEANDEQ